MKNKYRIEKDVVFIELKQKDGHNLETLIDSTDLSLVSSIGTTWFASYDPNVNNYYVYTRTYKNGIQKTIRLTRLLLDYPTNMMPDHKNHNTLDNRRSNLIIVTNKENSQNKRRRSDNTSGYPGVGFCKSSQKWRARIKKDGKTYFGGLYDTPEEAYRAYMQLKEKYHKYWAENISA